jgi:hypothetical protein
MTVDEPHILVAKMQKSAQHEVSSPGEKDFTTRQESLFQAAKMMNSCILQLRFS